jgi:uncharacterized protein (DUF2235 family)
MSKRIIICCDGTWNLPDQMNEGVLTPTNVVKMARAVVPKASDGTEQIVFYDKGVGAEQWGLDKLAAGAMGFGLERNIEDAYRFLMHNYNNGDEIFFFGFSRGAYTVRSTVGLINNSGLLKKIYSNKFWYAFNLYKKSSEYGMKFIKKIKKSFSREIDVKFISVWDTVGSLGIPELEGNGKIESDESDYLDMLDIACDTFRTLTKKHYEFHNVELSKIVKNAYHALAIDEKRAAFKPSLWSKEKRGQNIEQVWFPGVHSDVGGGYKNSGLSDIAFMWMKEKAEDCGLEFSTEYIKKNINPNKKEKIHDSKTGLFKKFEDHIRPIGKLGVNEAIHPVAKELFEDTDINYTPQNLKKYIKSNKCKIAETRTWPTD